MKKLLISLLLVSFCAFASSIPLKNISLANKFLASFLAGEMIGLQINSGNISQENLIDSLSLESDILGLVIIHLSTDLKGDELIIKADAEIDDTDSTYEELVEEIIESLPELIQDYPEYKVTYTISHENKKTLINFNIVPEDTASSINFIKGSIEINRGGLIKGAVEVSAKAKSETVLSAQVALTNIFNSLVAQQEPMENDMDVFFDIYESAMEEL